MKVLLALISLACLAFAQDCRDPVDPKCGPEEMSCWGGEENGCMMPDFCIPMKGNPGHDGMECPVSCPVKCGSEKFVCRI